MGYDDKDFQGKPIIGIINTWSDLLPCHTHFRERVEEVKRGLGRIVTLYHCSSTSYQIA
jgi:dihydroxy-acid dehydratase